MGSGNSGNYGNTKEKSQNYASSYHVTDGMHKLDINQGIYNDNVGYIKNPDAQRSKNVRELCKQAKRHLFLKK